ncbi:P-loop containing nucleoside triphosphate hydrolase protein [Xylariaceae sp. AK1471]|nr:P-loop containing nucleoside triphosphate hydrolase protein [Xylariaceae sp. AK1471]
MESTKIILCGDGSFGPAVENDSHGGFDFTAISPTAIFLLLALIRALALLRRRIAAKRNSLYIAKRIIIGAYIGQQLALVVQWVQPGLRSSVSIASTTLSLVSGNHLRFYRIQNTQSIRPSFLITGYLVITAFLDIARTRTRWLLKDADELLTLIRQAKEKMWARLSYIYLNPFLIQETSSHLTYQLMTMMRGGLAAMIYSTMLQIQVTKQNNSAAITLMSTNVQRIAKSFQYLVVETVPAVIQLAIATYLLYRQLGTVSVALLILSINKYSFCSNPYSGRMPRPKIPVGTLLSWQIADKITKRQKTWLEAIQRRIDFTSETLGSMKNIKICGQKIGIPGITGSGKSSAVQSILRMIDINTGRILMDNIDLATLTCSIVRKQVITLTQDPFLFTASVRLNVDPLGVYANEKISIALEKVKLWNVLQDKSKGGNPDIKAFLDTSMDRISYPTVSADYSVSVDTMTSTQIQEIIRSDFRNHTIIMIAHRLSSLLNFDLILVLDQGSLVEARHPAELLSDPSNRFAKMCH